MTVPIYLPLVLAVAVALCARWSAAGGAPGAAAWGLTVAAAVAAIASTWSLLLLALTMLDDVPPLSTLDGGANPERPEPVPGPIALLAGLALIVTGIRLWRAVHRRRATIGRLRRAGRSRDGMVVADWPVPMAIAVPGRPGHLLVTSGMLRVLDADERRVLFAHERAHLRHRHHGLVGAATAAAALHPVLISVRNAVAYLVERHADEVAAAAVGDRHLAAQALAHAALAASEVPATLSISGGGAVHRVRALHRPVPAPRRRRLLGPALLALGTVAASAAATVQFVALAQAWLR
jgi:Zn-dependent protease with chaperone function